MAAVPGLAAFPSLPRLLSRGPFGGAGPSWGLSGALIHWAPLYEMGLSWRQRCRGKKGLIESGLGPAPSPAGLLMFGGDFHITLKLLVFLPRLSLLPRMEDLKLKAALKMGNEANSTSGACALCVCVCARIHVCTCVCEHDGLWLPPDSLS